MFRFSSMKGPVRTPNVSKTAQALRHLTPDQIQRLKGVPSAEAAQRLKALSTEQNLAATTNNQPAVVRLHAAPTLRAGAGRSSSASTMQMTGVIGSANPTQRIPGGQSTVKTSDLGEYADLATTLQGVIQKGVQAQNQVRSAKETIQQIVETTNQRLSLLMQAQNSGQDISKNIIQLSTAILVVIDNITSLLHRTARTQANEYLRAQVTELQEVLVQLVELAPDTLLQQLPDRVLSEAKMFELTMELFSLGDKISDASDKLLQLEDMFKEAVEAGNKDLATAIETRINKRLRAIHKNMVAEEMILYAMTKMALHHRDLGITTAADTHFSHHLLWVIDQHHRERLTRDLQLLDQSMSVKSHKNLDQLIARRRQIQDTQAFMKQWKAVTENGIDVPDWVPAAISMERTYDVPDIAVDKPIYSVEQDPDGVLADLGWKIVKQGPDRYAEAVVKPGLVAIYVPHLQTRVIVPLDTQKAFDESDRTLLAIHGACSVNSDPESFAASCGSLTGTGRKYFDDKTFLVMFDNPYHAVSNFQDPRASTNDGFLKLVMDDYAGPLKALQAKAGKEQNLDGIGRSFGGIAVLALAFKYPGLFRNAHVTAAMAATQDWRRHLIEFVNDPEHDELAPHMLGYEWMLSLRDGWLQYILESYNDINPVAPGATTNTMVHFGMLDFQYPQRLDPKGWNRNFENPLTWPNVDAYDLWEGLAARNTGVLSMPVFSDHNVLDMNYPIARTWTTLVMAAQSKSPALGKAFLDFYRTRILTGEWARYESGLAQGKDVDLVQLLNSLIDDNPIAAVGLAEQTLVPLLRLKSPSLEQYDTMENIVAALEKMDTSSSPYAQIKSAELKARYLESHGSLADYEKADQSWQMALTTAMKQAHQAQAKNDLTSQVWLYLATQTFKSYVAALAKRKKHMANPILLLNNYMWLYQSLTSEDYNILTDSGYIVAKEWLGRLERYVQSTYTAIRVRSKAARQKDVAQETSHMTPKYDDAPFLRFSKVHEESFGLAMVQLESDSQSQGQSPIDWKAIAKRSLKDQFARVVTVIGRALQNDRFSEPEEYTVAKALIADARQNITRAQSAGLIEAPKASKWLQKLDTLESQLS